jgi:uncharacterized protein (TIGR02266 family)
VSENVSDRQHLRAPAHLSVSYRTSGAFLVAYTVNLSKGGIFIEAPPLEVGTEVSLALEVPEVGRLDVQGVVAWIREENSLGLPIGMGIQFSSGLDEKHGAAIDALVSTFEGLEILVMGSADRRALLARYVASILACETVEAETRSTAEIVLGEGIDLAIIDLDTSGTEGSDSLVVARATTPPTPVIALASSAEMQTWARAAGADQVVRSPPTFNELQAAVITALSRASPARAIEQPTST